MVAPVGSRPKRGRAKKAPVKVRRVTLSRAQGHTGTVLTLPPSNPSLRDALDYTLPLREVPDMSRSPLHRSRPSLLLLASGVVLLLSSPALRAAAPPGAGARGAGGGEASRRAARRGDGRGQGDRAVAARGPRAHARRRPDGGPRHGHARLRHGGPVRRRADAGDRARARRARR